MKVILTDISSAEVDEFVHVVGKLNCIGIHPFVDLSASLEGKLMDAGTLEFTSKEIN